MSKLQDIRELAQEHATLVSSSPRDWMGKGKKYRTINYIMLSPTCTLVVCLALFWTNPMG